MSTLIKKAEEAMKKKNYDYTIDLCLQELRMKPDNVGARRLLREAERERLNRGGGKAKGAFFKGIGPMLGATFSGLTKNYDKVMMSCEEYLKNNPNDTKFLIKLGQAAQKAGYLDTGIEVFKDVMSIDRKNTIALRALAQIYRGRDEIEKAANYYELLRKADPSDKEANKAVRQLAALASSRKMDKIKEEGEGDFRALIKDKDKARKLEKDARLLRSDKEIQDAIDETVEELKSNPKDHKKLSFLGDLYARQRKYDEAIEAYQKSYKLNDSDGTILNTIGDLGLKKLEDLVRRLKSANEKGGVDDYANKRRKLLVEKNKFCIKEWTRRVEAYPTEHGYKYDLGRYLYQGGKIDDAISYLQKAMEDPRKRRHSSNMLGLCFMKKKVFDLALKEFNKAIDGLPSSDNLFKEVNYNMGKTYQAKGDTPEALKTYEKILEIDYGYKDVAKIVTDLRS